MIILKIKYAACLQAANEVSLNRGSIRFYRSYQIYKKFYVRINFIKLILQKIRSSTCKEEAAAADYDHASMILRRRGNAWFN